MSEHNKRLETFGDPMEYGAMEYVYSLIATACGVTMMPCKLLDEGNRRHFITQRFDRIGNQKVHVQTLNGLAHVDYKKPGTCSYKKGSQWVNSHWMTLNGKRDHFVRKDFYLLEKLSPFFTRKKIDHILDEVIEQVSLEGGNH
ncbi:Toxin HigB / Protein kinase domain of HipA [hydrothermal vent metagenome]|uniref:Toxin HigB / Protein kinase domain of HipA n=1 Tax=hydrothermal vent metagenome TaxID=652676 RepID=A0A3B0X081_9ZZZZ